jgi:hypothetical protein
MLITSGGVLIRTRVKEIREMSRSTQGVTLINLDEGEKLSGPANHHGPRRRKWRKRERERERERRVGNGHAAILATSLPPHIKPAVAHLQLRRGAGDHAGRRCSRRRKWELVNWHGGRHVR